MATERRLCRGIEYGMDPWNKERSGAGLRGEDVAATDRMLKWEDCEEEEGHSI